MQTYLSHTMAVSTSPYVYKVALGSMVLWGSPKKKSQRQSKVLAKRPFTNPTPWAQLLLQSPALLVAVFTFRCEHLN